MTENIQSLIKAAHGHLTAGRLGHARDCCGRVLERNPAHPIALHLLGETARLAGEPKMAAGFLEKAIKASASTPAILCSLGLVRKDLGDFEGACEAFLKADEQGPGSAIALGNLGAVLVMLGRDEEAMAILRRALDLNPDAALAHENIAMIFRRRGQFGAALDHFRRASELSPGNAGILIQTGALLAEKGETEAAEALFREALEAGGGAEAHYSLAALYDNGSRPGAAASHYRQALELEPADARVVAAFHWFSQRNCAWEDTAALKQRLLEQTAAALDAGRKPALHPFAHLSLEDDDMLNLRIAERWTREIVEKAALSNLRLSHDPGRKAEGAPIVLGYLSSNFNNHPVAHLMRGVYGLHDRTRFTVHGYSTGKPDASFYQKAAERDCDRFSDIRDLSDEAAARLIHDDGVDILIDLCGYTEGTRMGIAALRPAPLQVNYLGGVGTSGAPFFDYIVSDAVATPRGREGAFSEAVVRLPNCYAPQDREEKISGKIFSRAEAGLPDDAFVYCSFNQAYKIDAAIFRVWMDILLAVPGSVLWLYPGNGEAARNLKSQALARGVAAERLIFAPPMAKADHLSRLRLADLALDTAIYKGGVTTSDALWAGVPVITVSGRHMPSRASMSKLSAMGLGELVCRSLDDYAGLAVRLAKNRDELTALGKKLEKNRLTLPLFDTERSVRNLERAYAEMWARRRRGLAPAGFSVREE